MLNRQSERVAGARALLDLVGAGGACGAALARGLGDRFCRLKALHLERVDGLPRLDDLFSRAACAALRPSLEKLRVDGCAGDLGIVPAALADLPKLASLALLSLSLSGPAPLDALSGLRRLEVLEMEACGLSGPLALGDEADFPKLARLSLRGNELDGPIPAALGSRRRFPKLAVLDLRRNALRGRRGTVKASPHHKESMASS